ncbi:ABC transporter permease [Paenibacillus albidus]|uniref:ABC transporter permease n=1 Tax=Paenibacillus albidus TaxID=2041023 RepID=UPI001BE7182B|nr:ABC transporter permease [Paenibacillus albidus]MBT2292918.1 ABC transporter permease [Paenibacillus albidus]
MYNLLRADLFKLRKSTAIKVLVGITVASASLMAWIAYLIAQGEMDGSMSGIGFLFSDMNVISILGAVVAGFLICGDFENKTIHDAIATGRSRGTVILSKAAVTCIALVVLLLPYAVITGIALSTDSKFGMGSVSLGFLHVLTAESGTGLSIPETARMLAVMLTLMIVYAAQLSITVPLALVLKKPVLVVALYYGFSIVCGQLAALGEQSHVLKSIMAGTPFGANYTLLTLDTGMGELLRALSVSLIFIVVMLALAYSAFRRAEIK